VIDGFFRLFVLASLGIVRLPKFRNFSEISRLFELAKILRKFCENSWEISSCLGLKTLFLRQKQGFPNIPNLRDIQNLFYSKLFKNYKKITLKSNFRNCEKLFPTQTFEFKFGLQGLTIVCDYVCFCLLLCVYVCVCVRLCACVCV